MATPLPPPPRILSLLDEVRDLQDRLLVEELLGLGGPSADSVADWLTAQGHSIGATTIKVYRRRLRQNGQLIGKTN